MSSQSTVAVITASVGRPAELADLVDQLQKQTQPPERIIISVVSEDDLPPDPFPDTVEVLMGEKGSCVQRNAGLDLVGDSCDYIAFFDDDYLPAVTAIADIASFFDENSDVVGINGHLVADGINGPGITREDALALIEDYGSRQSQSATTVELQGLYGCNMVVRASAVGSVRFDEALPLYGWQEDIDFANQLLPHGRLVKSTAFYGVHRGTKRARSPGVRVGYSQIANPLYLIRKGTLSRREGLTLLFKNVAANHIKAFRPEPWVDRLGRARGNWRAVGDIVSGRLEPSRILEF